MSGTLVGAVGKIVAEFGIVGTADATTFMSAGRVGGGAIVSSLLFHFNNSVWIYLKKLTAI